MNAPDDLEAMRERNREIIAQRLGYPDGTVEAEREIERRCPDYCAWFSKGDMPGQPGPRYGARIRNARFSDPTYYGTTPNEVVKQIEADHRS